MKQKLLHGIIGLALLTMSLPMQAGGVKWLEKCLDVSKLEIKQGSNVITPVVDGTTIKISGTSNNELKVTLKPSEKLLMTNRLTYVVIESNTTFDNTKIGCPICCTHFFRQQGGFCV